MSRSLLLVIVRWSIAIALEFVAARLLIGAASSGDYLGAMAKCLYGFALLMLGIILLGPELVRWAAMPIQHVLTGLLFPSQSETPPADYKLPRFYRRQSRHEEAVEQYWKIVRYHPDELTAYVEGIEAAIAAEAPETAAKFHRSGLRHLRNPDARRELQGAYESAKELIASTGNLHQNQASPAALIEDKTE